MMEFLSVGLLVIVIYLLLNHKNYYSAQIVRLEARISELQSLVKQIGANNSLQDKPKVTEVKPAPVIRPELHTDLKAPVSTPPPDPETEKRKDPTPDPLADIRKRVPTPIEHSGPKPAYKQPEPRLSFFERHPDLEKFIGENLINKIGIAILVLAIGYFVKYAIDNNWIGPVGRVAIGVTFGGILIGIAHRMRNSYQAFSSVLVGGGMAILYFTITLAYHQFHLFNQLTSLIILIIITGFAVILSLLYNRQELAVIALVGGLASPFMVSNGQANYAGLFTYLVILNAGLLIIAYYKTWRILNATAFGLTVIVFLLVLTSLTPATYLTGFIYAGILYLMFFGINVANNIKENKRFVGSDFSILLINTALYFAVGLYLLTAMHHEGLRGLFSISLAVLNLLLSFILFRNKKADTNVLYLLIGITLTFISLTAPIQLNGHYITMFWAAETVLLYWLYLKSGIKLMQLTSWVIWGAMLISLLMDWGDLYGSSALYLPIIANKGFITTLFAALACYLLYLLVNKGGKQKLYGFDIPISPFRYTAIILLFLSGYLEVNHQFANRFPEAELNILYLMLYSTAFLYLFITLSKRLFAIKLDWKVTAITMSIFIAAYLLCIPAIFDLEEVSLVQHQISQNHFYAHFLSAIFMGMLLDSLANLIKDNFTGKFKPAAIWLLTATIVLFLSLEFSIASNLLFYSSGTNISRIETVYIKVGLPILWGLCSFALMILGMHNKVRTLRIISLTLFTLTLLKLFLFDIRNIPPAGKIAAFFCLGIILLTVSFMYQKVKKILVEDDNNKNAE